MQMLKVIDVQTVLYGRVLKWRKLNKLLNLSDRSDVFVQCEEIYWIK
jgi:hypothetical protein